MPHSTSATRVHALARTEKGSENTPKPNPASVAICVASGGAPFWGNCCQYSMANAPVAILSVIPTRPIIVAVCRHSANCFSVEFRHSHQPHTQLNGGIPKNAMFTAQAAQFIGL